MSNASVPELLAKRHPGYALKRTQHALRTSMDGRCGRLASLHLNMPYSAPSNSIRVYRARRWRVRRSSLHRPCKGLSQI